MFQIIVDSAANIPAELVKQYHIMVLFFVIFLNGEMLICFDLELTYVVVREMGKTYYDAMRNGAVVMRSLISTGDF